VRARQFGCRPVRHEQRRKELPHSNFFLIAATRCNTRQNPSPIRNTELVGASTLNHLKGCPRSHAILSDTTRFYPAQPAVPAPGDGGWSNARCPMLDTGCSKKPLPSSI